MIIFDWCRFVYINWVKH